MALGRWLVLAGAYIIYPFQATEFAELSRPTHQFGFHNYPISLPIKCQCSITFLDSYSWFISPFNHSNSPSSQIGPQKIQKLLFLGQFGIPTPWVIHGPWREKKLVWHMCLKISDFPTGNMVVNKSTRTGICDAIQCCKRMYIRICNQ